MAFDGIVVSALTSELSERLKEGRILKIAQPEDDELIITVKTLKGQERLDICVSASLPFMYLTDRNKTAPMTAPGFCMLLRKHLTNGRIKDIVQPGLERIVRISIEHFDELGDLRTLTLVTELMGKHSNIILLDGEETVIDSIRHIPASVSSVREVLPGRSYFVPNTEDKKDFLSENEEGFKARLISGSHEVMKELYTSYTGFSPLIASELCLRVGIDPSDNAEILDRERIERLWAELCKLRQFLEAGSFHPMIYYKDKDPAEFYVTDLISYPAAASREFSTVSEMLITYYSEKARVSRIRAHSADLRKIVSLAVGRNARKHDIQLKQLKSTEKRDKYRIYGELINTYGYGVKEGEKSFTAVNYYDNKEITIPLDPDISVQENAVRYFDRYNKLKRTREAVTKQLEDTVREQEHLESIQNALDIAADEADLKEIKQELMESGYIKKHSGKKGDSRLKSAPLHYISSDGYDLYVGKNNYQNDQLTFKFAAGNDWWFHSKKFPGSHVILHPGDKDKDSIPDRAFNEAGALAAYYSRGRDQSKVEIDYVQKKEVKKPAGAKPGFVVYYTNYSMAIAPGIEGLTKVES